MVRGWWGDVDGGWDGDDASGHIVTVMGDPGRCGDGWTDSNNGIRREISDT